jgi:hypothetical protein
MRDSNGLDSLLARSEILQPAVENGGTHLSRQSGEKVQPLVAQLRKHCLDIRRDLLCGVTETFCPPTMLYC